jgi:hypothetical protein
MGKGQNGGSCVEPLLLKRPFYLLSHIVFAGSRSIRITLQDTCRDLEKL